MGGVYLIGGYSTAFGKKFGQDYKSLTREAYVGTLADAGMADGGDVDFCWFGNCQLHVEGQGNIRGQVCMSPLVDAGLFPARVPIINVENACATSSCALVSACMAVQCDQSALSLVVGVEKLIDPATGKGRFDAFDGGIDQLDPRRWQDYYRAAGEQAGKSFELGPGRTPFMDTYAMQACYHMKRHGSTQRQLAIAAANAHEFGALNPRAQYRFTMTPDEVLADRKVTWPLTRAMCAPMGDGAAGLLVCSADYLASCPAEIRERAVRVLGYGMSGGMYRGLDEPGLTQAAARRAYAAAGVGPADIDVAEIHDATAFSHLYQCEMLGFCEPGEGGRFIESGATRLEGRIPLNVSGGLISKGHPVGATGASMLVELMEQLRGEAGKRQVPGAALALAENGGGVIGFDEAVAVVTILQRV